VVLIGSIGVAVYQLAFFWSTRSTGVAMASIVTIGASPIASWFIGAARRRPAPPPAWFGAALLIAIGLTVLVTGGYETVEVVPSGVVAAILAGAAYAAYTEAGSILVEGSIPGTAVMAGLFMGAGAITSPLLIWTGIDMLQSTRGVLVLGYLALITLTVAYVAFGWSLSYLTPTFVVMLTLLEPVVAAVLSVVVLHQNLSVTGWLGACVVCIGMFLAGRAARSSRTTVTS
jgi:DME family drug/metabolite transporter